MYQHLTNPRARRRVPQRKPPRAVIARMTDHGVANDGGITVMVGTNLDEGPHRDRHRISNLFHLKNMMDQWMFEPTTALYEKAMLTYEMER